MENYIERQMTAHVFGIGNLCTRCTARIPRPDPIFIGAGGGDLGADSVTLAQVCDNCVEEYKRWFSSPPAVVN